MIARTRTKCGRRQWTVMLTRTAVMFEVIADRRGWPDRMR